MLRQLQRGLCPQGGMERLDHIGTQAIALAFQVKLGDRLTDAGRSDACSALAAQFQRLAEGDGGGAGVPARVLHLPRQLGVGQ